MKYRFSWPPAIIAGLIAGVIFLVLEMIMVPLFLGGSAWTPPRMYAGLLMGGDVVGPETFDFGVFIVALLVVLVLAVVLGIVISLIVNPLTLPTAVVVGAILGLLLYWVNFYGFSAFWEHLALARNWVTVFTNISFGIAAAWSYKGLQPKWAKPIPPEEEPAV